MSIIGAYPVTIANGQVEDATVVMQMFNWILAQTNSNACPATSGSAMQKANGSGGLAGAVAWTDFVAPAAQVSVASAATTNFGGSGSPLLNLTGGTTISSGGTTYVGPVITRFAVATTLTQSSAFNLLGGVSFTAQAGDYAEWVPQVGGTGWDMVSYASATAGPVVNQTWQNPARVLSTNYTNNTGRNIFLTLTLFVPNGAAAGINVQGWGSIAGAVNSTGASGTIYLQAVIPNGATYSASTSGGTLSTWNELR